MCDASAGVAVDATRFLVANDEDNTLRLYHRERGDVPLAEFDMSDFIRPDPDKPESDIEGATWLDGRVYWITSHGRNKADKQRESRHRLFATEIVLSGEHVAVRGVGTPYSTLLSDLVSDARLKKYNLEAASERAPKKKDALNIEGLAATPDGKLLLGFRNPQPRGKALVLVIENPREVVEGRRAKLGDPIELELTSAAGAPLGIRSIEYHAALGRYLIVGGSYKAAGAFDLFSWSGKAQQQPQRIKGVDFANLGPEAIVLWPEKGAASATGKTWSRRIQLLSDDGTKPVGSVECKHASDPNQRSFRTAWLTVE